jgi:hypothetical protein
MHTPEQESNVVPVLTEHPPVVAQWAVTRPPLDWNVHVGRAGPTATHVSGAALAGVAPMVAATTVATRERFLMLVRMRRSLERERDRQGSRRRVPNPFE